MARIDLEQKPWIMKSSYHDILSRISEPPSWFDKHGVPRYEAFSPEAVADVYTREIALFEVRCQACGRVFKVSRSGRTIGDPHSLTSSIDARRLCYGDPPAVGCCPTGAVMNSVPVRVLELWRRRGIEKWERDRSRDGTDILPDWARDGEPVEEIDTVESD